MASWARVVAEVRAAWQAGDRSPELLDAARRCADDIVQAGLVVAGLDARLIVAQLALELNHPQVARRKLDQAGRARRRGSVELRARAWHAGALSRLADGNRRGAQTALRAGCGRSTASGSPWARPSYAPTSPAMASSWAGSACVWRWEDQSPTRMLAWAERSRARSLMPRPIRPPDDPELAAILAELWRVTVELNQTAVETGTTSRLLARQAALEQAVQRRVRRPIGPEGTEPSDVPSPTALRDLLGQRALIEIVQLDQSLHALVVAG